MIEKKDRGRTRASRWAAVMLGSIFGMSAMGLLATSLLFQGGCTPEPKDAVVSMNGWAANLPTLQEEFNRLKGAGAFDTTSVAGRETFARTLADKEILLRLAHKKYPELIGKQARIYRVTYEKALQTGYLKYRRDLYKITPEQLAQALPMVARHAVLRVARLPSKEVGAQVHEAQNAGMSFEDVVAKYGMDQLVPPAMQNPKAPKVDTKWQETTVGIDIPKSPPSLLIQGLLRNLPAGSMTPPIDAQGTIYIAKLVRYEPMPAASDPGFANRAKPMVENLGYMGVNQAWADSIRAAYKYAVHHESYPTIQKCMSAYWDSLDGCRVKGIPVDFQALRAPTWSLTPEERAKPCYDMGGKTWTVGDFIESLNGIDLDYWPTLGDLDRVTFQADGRVMRLMLQLVAEKDGYPKNPEFAAHMKKIEEQCFLSQYFDLLGDKEITSTDDELKAYYDNHPNAYTSPERVAFSFLTYPEAKKARAAATLAKLRAGGPLLWFELAPAEAKADPTVTYQPPTDMMDTSRPTAVSGWTPYMKAARGTDAGTISDLVLGPWGATIVRTQDRQPSRRMSLQEATAVIRGQLQTEKRESMIEKVLADQRKKNHVKVHVDRLGEPAKKSS